MSYTSFALLVSLALCVAMVGLMEIGRRAGRRKHAADAEAAAGTGAIDAAVFGLLGLLVAFSFSGAAERFDERRHLLVEETNAIGTAYLRLELVPAAARPELRDLFRAYVETRIATYRSADDPTRFRAGLARGEALQRQIWTRAVAAGQHAPAAAAMLLLPALNDMIDITTTRTLATRIHPPRPVLVMLFGLSLVAALLAGRGMARTADRSWLHVLGFAVALATTVYVIIDLEYPRLGLIRVDAFDQALVELRASMT